MTDDPEPKKLKRASDVEAAALEEAPHFAGYDVLGVLGQGGMGIVYKARDVELSRVVALKVLAAGHVASEEASTRFQTETRAVAQLRHPNIAQVYEVGKVAGQPYYAMEYVEGGSLADRTDGKPQSPDKAALLVETLARVVHFSHGKGIIHRDLKPANILLAHDGTPKITDFGVAKSLAEESGATRTGEVLGTPRYMAPEQATGVVKKTGPSCDIYSLGAILYELLTGRAPFHAPDSLQTILLVVSEEPVPPRRLQPKIPRDLETICLKCLEKTRRRRYATAEHLADDLLRFSEGHPILARPVRFWERIAKWARRRPAAAGLVSVSCAAVLALLLGNTWHNASLRKELDRSERLFEEGQGLARWLLFDHTEAIGRLMGATTAHEALVTRVLTYLDGLARNAGNDLTLAADIAHAYERIADVQGHPGFSHAGKTEHALESYRKALRLRAKVLAANPGDLTANLNHLLCESKVADMLAATGKIQEARLNYDALLERLDGFRQDRPPNKRIESASVLIRHGIGDLGEAAGDLDEAITQHRHALSQAEALFGADVDDQEGQRQVAFSHSRLGHALEARGELEEAEVHYEKILAYAKSAAQKSPVDAQAQRWLSLALIAYGDLLTRLEKPSAALELYQHAVEVRRVHSLEDPRSANVQRDLGVALERVVSAREILRDFTAMIEPLRESLEITKELVRRDPERVSHRRDLWIKQFKMGSALLATGHVDGAEVEYHNGLENAQALVKLNQKSILDLQGLAEGHCHLGDIQIRRLAPDMDFTTQLSCYRKAIDLYQKGAAVLGEVAKLAPLTPGQEKLLEAARRKIEFLKEHLAILEESDP